MSSFSTSIHQVVTQALLDLKEAQAKGKIPKNPLSETHFLAAWTTNAIKKKRFDSDVVPTLTIWQRKARSLGKNAALVETFTAIKENYEHVFDENLKTKPVNKDQIVALCEALTSQQWMVNTDLEVGEKLNRHSGGQASLIICSQAFASNFEHGLLAKPISLYIRGDVAEALQAAYAQSLLLYKVTDYKSKVKYHGEYIIYANNDGEFLPELVTL
ncbi:DUF2913 family protein [Psychromonas algicola]|uniref:DUF2913 family protein n=1 Tax=Psychromonas algicola TaxID=2555642 RepID=UPI001067C1C0|nr:DUF2913 family protein [Psychromonas sp. RZ5]TEW52970.1 DUF2913 family protein [Psychromonas sp. RZ5]